MKIDKDKIIENKLSMFGDSQLEKWELCIDTYNITVKCNTYEEREKVLDTLDNGTTNDYETLIEQKVIGYRDKANVFFNEDHVGFPTNSLRILI
tara:strand:+ start:76 stop:357 length:282 start_codon:yes stop_codon:yes gene_type:complete